MSRASPDRAEPGQQYIVSTVKLAVDPISRVGAGQSHGVRPDHHTETQALMQEQYHPPEASSLQL